KQECDLLGQQLARDYKDVTPERLEELDTAAGVAGVRATESRAAHAASADALQLARELTHSRGQSTALSSQQASLATECATIDREARTREQPLTSLREAATLVDREMSDVAYDDARPLLLGTVEPHAARREQILQRLAVLEGDMRTHAANLKTAQE